MIPEFEPVGYLNNRDSFCHKDSPWVKANPEECAPLFTEAQLREVFEAGKAESNAVMKSYYESVVEDGGKRITELKEQITEQQAHIGVLMNCLKGWHGLYPEDMDAVDAAALAIPSSQEALKEHDAKLMERVAVQIAERDNYTEPLDDFDNGWSAGNNGCADLLNTIAAQIREGKWK